MKPEGRVRYNRASVSRPTSEVHSSLVEALHMVALAIGAIGLTAGLVSRKTEWANLGVSLILVLPPLRVATSIVEEARAKRFGVAAMGALVLAFLFFSRRIS
jgi:hypothetical protein